jgi:2-oxoglutarate ferredoxin oxidoreductase subunit gamma
MSLPALEKFESWIRPGGTLIVDSHQIKKSDFRKDINVIEIPATKLAIDAGNVKFANVVMMGAMMAAIKAPSFSGMEEAVRDMLPKEKEALFPLEMNALSLGLNFVK